MSKKLILILISLIIPVGFLFADIEDLRIYYLDKEYQRAIDEALEIIKSYSAREKRQEAYFYLALSQMKLGYYKEARDNYRIIVKNYSKGEFSQRAYLGVADCFFLEGNYSKAVDIYKAFLDKFSRSDFSNIAYFRLGQANLKLGNWKIAKDYLKELRRKFPGSLEAKLAKDLLARDEFFTVQVAAFINQNSAKQLNNKLKEEDFDSYIVKVNTDDAKTLYRVRVGRLSSRYDAEALQAALSLKGYPARIYP